MFQISLINVHFLVFLNIFSLMCFVFITLFSAPSIYGGLNCDPDQVPINNKCYPSVGRGQQCFYNEQCILEVALECRNGICQYRFQSEQYPIPVGPGPVIFPPAPALPEPPVIYPYPVPQYPLPRPPQYPSPLSFPNPPKITVITICCLRANSWPCCLRCCFN